METEFIDMLGDIGRSSVARLSPEINLAGDTASARRASVLSSIRGTILPRRLEFTAANGACLAIEVSSSRITDVFRCVEGPVPDFETEAREDLTDKMARLLTDIATAPGPLTLASLRPDMVLEADDVGLTFSEVETACRQIEVSESPPIAIVPDQPEPSEIVEPEEAVQPAPTQAGPATLFFEGSEKVALGRLLIGEQGGTEVEPEGLFAVDQPAQVDDALLKQFVRDLSGWHAESGTEMPQLIVMRPFEGQGSGLAVLSDGEKTATVLHENRKLGAIVSLWKSLRKAVE